MSMNVVSAFRWLLSISIVLGLVGAISEFATVPLLPETLQSYWKETWDLEAEVSASEMILGLLAILCFPVLIIGYVGLFLLKSWGRTVFIFAAIFFWLLTPLMGPFVLTSITYMFYDLASAAMGAIIAMAYLPPIADKIDGKEA